MRTGGALRDHRLMAVILSGSGDAFHIFEGLSEGEVNYGYKVVLGSVLFDGDQGAGG
jgi:hypothetical protein